MDAADHNEGVTEQTIRYIITRPCLAEGSLRLLKYLQPLFPADGQVQLQDSRGELFNATVETINGRLTGVGELYRAHNLGVNDVLHLRRAEERRYLVECVVKPHARNQPSNTERPAPMPVVTEKRVVIHATPHVREVRMERVTLTVGSRPESAQTPKMVEPAQLRSVESHAAPGQSVVAQAGAGTNQPAGQANGGQFSRDQASGTQPTPVRTVTVQAVQGRAGMGQRATPLSRSAAPISSLTARMQQSSAPTRLSVGLNTPIQINFPALSVPVSPTPAPVLLSAALHSAAPTPADSAQNTDAAVQNLAVQGLSLQGLATPAETSAVAAQTALTGTPPSPAVVSARVSESLTVQPLTVGPSPVMTPEVNPAPSSTYKAPVGAAHAARSQAPVPRPAESSSPPTAVQHNPEDQLTALARLTGYACEHLGSGVVRLQAELGPQSYSVLIATTPQALTTLAWSENCDYMALLTPEDQRPQGIPRFTYAALEALLEHARLAPLTPIDLRGYWNTGSFDQESVESVAELVSAHLAQRGSFSHVLLTLAQQPAHSLVHLPRLAERLGSGVNTAELESILETLSRPPFQALTPLPNGQYYLRSDVRDLLQEFGEYAEGMRRRIRPSPLAATGR